MDFEELKDQCHEYQRANWREEETGEWLWQVTDASLNALAEIDRLKAQLAYRDALIKRMDYAGNMLRDYAIMASLDHPMGDGQMALNDKTAWDSLVAECRARVIGFPQKNCENWLNFGLQNS